MRQRFSQGMIKQESLAPVVVRARTDHEFELVALRKMLKIFNPIARGLVRGRRLDIDYPRNTRINLCHVERTAGFQRNCKTGIAQPFEQSQAIGLRQGLAAGHTDVVGLEAR